MKCKKNNNKIDFASVGFTDCVTKTMIKRWNANEVNNNKILDVAKNVFDFLFYFLFSNDAHVIEVVSSVDRTDFVRQNEFRLRIFACVNSDAEAIAK